MATYDLEVRNVQGAAISRVGDLACIDRTISTTGNHTLKIGLNAGVFAFMGSDMFTKRGNLLFIEFFDGENLTVFNYAPNKLFVGRF